VRKLTDHIVEGDSVNHQLEIEVRDDPGQGGANHRYSIIGFHTASNPATKPDLLGEPQNQLLILFQNGPIREAGVNGITHEALLAILIDRLKAFQKGPFPSSNTDTALLHCSAALSALKNRTVERMARGVEGTHQK
jgi:hypothetical protein